MYLLYIFSIYLYFTGKSPLYFETTAVIIALVMVGDRLEEKAIEKTTSSLSSLAKMQIKSARKLIEGVFKEVSLNAVKKGDTVQVNQGDQIPTDGEVLEGSGMVDEAGSRHCRRGARGAPGPSRQSPARRWSQSRSGSGSTICLQPRWHC